MPSAPPNLARLFATVQSWFEPAVLIQTLAFGDSPIERISEEWMARSGKRWRPFLNASLASAFEDFPHDQVPPAVRLTSVAVECIHKGSLVYDDIQDDDQVRYGEPTLHVVHGRAVAMTVALHLIGLGYRLIAEAPLPADRVTAMLRLATDGHCRLCLGQGGELLWMREPRPLSPEQVLEIFRFKTAPSFDVVIRLPAHAAGAPEHLQTGLARFAEILGTAYQVKDDLDDFHGGGDVDDICSRRPSIIMAIAHQRATPADRTILADTWCGTARDFTAVKRIIADTQAATAALAVLRQHKVEALATIATLNHPRLPTMLRRIADMIFGQA